jgi:hypothetical protein
VVALRRGVEVEDVLEDVFDHVGGETAADHAQTFGGCLAD